MSIADKISKIIAKADSTTSPAEAAAFMEKAHKMMREHGLNLLDLGKLAEDPLEMQRDAVTTDARQTWARLVAAKLARYYGCDFVWYKRGNHIFYDVAGRESARVTFIMMLPFVCKQVRSIGNAAHRRGEYKSAGEAHRKVGQALAMRIHCMTPEKDEHRGSGLNALVPVDLIQGMIDDEGAEEARPMNVSYDHNARELAKEVSINVQTTAADGNAKKLAAK